jgi:hypothetical protein
MTLCYVSPFIPDTGFLHYVDKFFEKMEQQTEATKRQQELDWIKRRPKCVSVVHSFLVCEDEQACVERKYCNKCEHFPCITKDEILDAVYLWKVMRKLTDKVEDKSI